HFQRVRPASVASLRVVGFDQVGEDLPGNGPFHLCQELLAARHLALACKFGVGKAQLAHWGLPDWVSFNNLHSDRSRGLVQTFPKYLPNLTSRRSILRIVFVSAVQPARGLY